MKLAYSPEHQALRQELRDYYKKLLTPEVLEEVARSEGVGPIVRKIVRRMGEDGWLGIGWPKEYGGRGMTPIEQFIFFDESMRAGAPVPMLTINSVAPTIMQFGTAFYLEAYRLMLEILGNAANFRPGSPEAVLNGRVGFVLRIIHVLTFGAGTNEMQRDLIALFGLGMPVQPRF